MQTAELLARIVLLLEEKALYEIFGGGRRLPQLFFKTTQTFKFSTFRGCGFIIIGNTTNNAKT